MILTDVDITSMVKTNTKVFYKETIEKPTMDWLGDSYFMLKRKSVVPEDRPLIAIG